MLKEEIKKASLASRKNVMKLGLKSDACMPFVHESNLLTTLLGEIDTMEKKFSPAREATDAEVLAVVQKFKKNLDESIRVGGIGEPGSPRRIQNQIEADVLAHFMPAQLDDMEIIAKARERSQAGDNLGGIMKWFKENHSGEYDGKKLRDLVLAVMEESLERRP